MEHGKTIGIHVLLPGWWYTYPSEKYEFVNGKDDIPYMKWKIKAMFQTTNQLHVSIEKNERAKITWFITLGPLG